MLNDGERQVAPTLAGIRRDHLARYEWAARFLPPGSRIIDLACGVGYGASVLAEAGHTVLALDRDAEAIAYARQHWRRPGIIFDCFAAEDPELTLDRWNADAAVCFETLEHLEHPEELLTKLAGAVSVLLASVPNETVFPFRNYRFHHRHYTRAEFEELLRRTGWEVDAWYGQAGPESEVEHAVEGRTLIAQARRGAIAERPAVAEAPLGIAGTVPADVAATLTAPEHVVILGLGPSLETYLDLVKRLGGRKRFADEVWGINALGDILQCDRIFHMDDVKLQERRAAAAPDSNIAVMVEWLRRHPGPIVTSRAYPDYPGLVEFPLEAVINDLGYVYFNGTCAYAVAYAIHLGVKRISLFGCDFTYPNSHHAERGRACVEFWLGVAHQRGIELCFSDRTSLLDQIEDLRAGGEAPPYGYDAVDVKVERRPDGSAAVSFTPKELPTAAEIERRYDHTQHPNALVNLETPK